MVLVTNVIELGSHVGARYAQPQSGDPAITYASLISGTNLAMQGLGTRTFSQACLVSTRTRVHRLRATGREFACA